MWYANSRIKVTNSNNTTNKNKVLVKFLDFGFDVGYSCIKKKGVDDDKRYWNRDKSFNYKTYDFR